MFHPGPVYIDLLRSTPEYRDCVTHPSIFLQDCSRIIEFNCSFSTCVEQCVISFSLECFHLAVSWRMGCTDTGRECEVVFLCRANRSLHSLITQGYLLHCRFLQRYDVLFSDLWPCTPCNGDSSFVHVHLLGSLWNIYRCILLFICVFSSKRFWVVLNVAETCECMVSAKSAVCMFLSDARTCSMANCQYGCEVMKGEVRCQCPSPGLQLAPDGRTCVGMCS